MRFPKRRLLWSLLRKYFPQAGAQKGWTQRAFLNYFAGPPDGKHAKMTEDSPDNLETSPQRDDLDLFGSFWDLLEVLIQKGCIYILALLQRFTSISDV